VVEGVRRDLDRLEAPPGAHHQAQYEPAGETGIWEGGFTTQESRPNLRERLKRRARHSNHEDISWKKRSAYAEEGRKRSLCQKG